MAIPTAKQISFVDEYLVDLNATQAAIRAGYSKKTAHAIGQENLRKPIIAQLIAERREYLQKRTEVTQERVITELAKIGFSDLRKALTDNGQLLAPTDWDDETAGAIGSVEVVTTRLRGNDDEPPEIEYTHKIRMWDKLNALDKIGKHLGMWDKGPNEGLEEIAKALSQFAADREA